MPTIFVSGVEFYGYHGVSAAEREVGHRFSVDAELEVDTRATETDELSDTIDYGSVALALVEIGAGPSCKTVERLAMRMAERLLADHPSASGVQIELRKLLPPIAAVLESAGIRLTKQRASPATVDAGNAQRKQP